MKLHGQTLVARPRKTVLWRRMDGSEHELTLTALPLAFGTWLRERGIIQPDPPVRVARDAQGKPIRDAQGQAVVTEDRHDRDYLLRLEAYQQRLAMLVLWQATRDESQLTWETPTPDVHGDWLSFADDLFEELEQAGVTMGEVTWLCEEATSHSSLVTQAVADRRADFFPAASSLTSSGG